MIEDVKRKLLWFRKKFNKEEKLKEWIKENLVVIVRDLSKLSKEKDSEEDSNEIEIVFLSYTGQIYFGMYKRTYVCSAKFPKDKGKLLLKVFADALNEENILAKYEQTRVVVTI